MSKKRFLLCRPRGGLNDMLNQVEKCWRYADAYDRVLVVDTVETAFGTALSNFFEEKTPGESVIFSPSKELMKYFDTITCFPKSLEGRICDYNARFISGQNFVDMDTGTKISFAFGIDYPQEILIHHQCGGGNLSNHLWKRIRLSENMRRKALENQTKIFSLTSNYASIHIRNTDYETDYMRFTERCLRKIKFKSVLVCSDSRQTLKTLENKFGDRILESSMAPDTGGRPLHSCSTFSSKLDVIEQMEKSILDLIALSSGSMFFYTDTLGGFPSGFSRMAEFLQEHKKILCEMSGLEPQLCGFIGSRSGRAVYISKPSRRIGWRIKKWFIF